MPSRLTIFLVTTLTAVLLTVAVVAAWKADRREHVRLRAELSVAQQALSRAQDQQKDRHAQLRQQLDALAEKKHAVRAPAQIVSELPGLMGLPAPIALDPGTPVVANANDTGVPGAQPSGPKAAGNSKMEAPIAGAADSARIPAADLKPLYDFAVDCKSCQLKLDASQRDLIDEKSKTAILTKERDAAVRAANGGSVLRRMARATKWFLIGAAAGAVLARTAR
jgi:hypothetical protein